MATLTVGAHEAKVHFSEYLDRAAHGDTVTVTKHGRAVAVIAPVQASDDAYRARARKAIALFDKAAKGQSWGDVDFNALVDEGRP